MSDNRNPLERLASLFADPKSRVTKPDKPRNPWIILAIGNPGAEYAETRHNVGWWAADVLLKHHNAKLKDEGPSRIAHVKIENQPVIIAYPITYVNRSGAAARNLIQNYQTEIHRIIVITDDINLEPGRIRVRRSGGDGGHNGLKSIISTISDTNFPRIRIGIGKPTKGDTQIDHVLGKPSNEDLSLIMQASRRAAEAAATIIAQGVETAMNEFNHRSSSASSQDNIE